ncbi:MAG: ISL3 family transposase [Planctomycetes bacterium]|nr:ISL3 family transposase [Planctomycetota bacterium]
MMTTFEIPLDIPDVTIEHVEINKQGEIIITVKSTIEETKCRKCGRRITKGHGHDKEVTLRHLSILGGKTFIRIRPARYKCLHCKRKPTTTQKLSWYVHRSPHTKAYDEHILCELINSTVEDVSLKEDIGYKAVMGIIDRYIRNSVEWKKIKRLDVIGLDEISLKKGHKDFVTIVTGRRGGKTIILAVLKDRQKTTVQTFLESIPLRIRRTVAAICSDMYDGFVNAAKEVFGSQVIIIDRFHVAKLYRGALDRLRKQELKRLKKELSEEEYQKLKGVMWLLRKNKEELSPDELSTLECLFRHSPSLKLAYTFSQELTEIFDQDLSKRQAQHHIRVWKKRVKQSGLKCFNGFLKTLGKYIHHITNYFLNRQTSGFVEGLNNKIKVIKRRCYGIFNVKHLFQRIHLDLEGYTCYL